MRSTSGRWRVAPRARAGSLAALAAPALFALLALLALALACAAGAARADEAAGSDSSAGPDLDAPAPVARPAARRAPNVLAWPVYVRWDTDAGRALRVFGPATVSQRTPAERSFHLLWPTTGLRRLAAGRTELNLAWPLTSVVRDSARGLFAVRLATPLVGFERREDAHGRSLVLSPLYADERLAGGRRRFEVAPLYWRLDDGKTGFRAREYGYVPLLGGGAFALHRRWSGPRGQGWSSALLLGGAERGSERWLWLFPYASYENRGASPVRVRTFGGAWSDWRTPRSRGWELALLLGGGRTATDAWLSLPPWVSYAHTDSVKGTSRFRTLLPLWARWQAPGSDLQLALPSLWSWRSERLVSSGAWPFYASFRRARADSSWRSGGSFAWPFLTWGRGEDYSAFGVLPLFYRVRDGGTSLTVAMPFYGAFRDPARDVRVIPLAWFRRYAPRDSLDVFGLYYRRRTPSHFAHGLPMLWESSVTGDARQSWVFPVWYHRRDPGGELLAVPGWIDSRSAAGGRRTFVAGPVVVTRGTGTRGFGIVPLFYSASWPGGGAGLAGPVYWDRAAGGDRHVSVVPLAWYARVRDRTDLFLLPLTGWRRWDDGRSSSAVLWPLYTHRAWAGGRTRHSLLLWLGRDERDGAKRRAWLQPLFYYDRPSERSSWFAMLGGLLASYERDGTERRLKVLLVPVKTWKG